MRSNLSFLKVLGCLNMSRVSKVQFKPLILLNKILSCNETYLVEKLVPDYIHYRFPKRLWGTNSLEIILERLKL